VVYNKAMVNIELKIVSTKVNVFEQMECQFFFQNKNEEQIITNVTYEHML